MGSIISSIIILPFALAILPITISISITLWILNKIFALSLVLIGLSAIPLGAVAYYAGRWVSSLVREHKWVKEGGPKEGWQEERKRRRDARNEHLLAKFVARQEHSWEKNAKREKAKQLKDEERAARLNPLASCTTIVIQEVSVRNF